MDRQNDPTQMTQLSGMFFVIVCHFSGLVAGVWEISVVELPHHLAFVPSGHLVRCVGMVALLPMGNGHHIAFVWESHTDTIYLVFVPHWQ